MGVAIYGGILIGIPALVRGPPDNPLPISGFLLAAFGVVVVVIVAGVLLVLVGGRRPWRHWPQASPCSS